MMQDSAKTIIGQSELVAFPGLGSGTAYARIDTGAQTSAIWASRVELIDGRLHVVFFGPGHTMYTGKVHKFDEFTRTKVRSSNGHWELRYKAKVVVEVAGRRIVASFTLADRSKQVYPVLVGRNVLRGKFIVDVKRGKPLATAKNMSTSKLQKGVDL